MDRELSGRARIKLLAGAVGLALASCALVRSGAWTQAQEHFDAADYRTAIQKADQVLSTGDPSPQERANANLLKAQCFEKLGQLGDALALYAFVAKSFPDTPQAYQATVALARLTPAPQPAVDRGSF